MCAIHGIFKKDVSMVMNMVAKSHHRGPDGRGTWHDEFITLGHNLLSIVDEPTESLQPWNHNNLILVFNGEIYNYKELGAEFELTTNTDTEVIARGVEKYGDAFLDKLDGMFGLAIYFKREKQLLLARDSNGTKPVYYGFDKDYNICFSSEIKALLEIGFERKLSKPAFAHYQKAGYNSGYLTLFEGIQKLVPGEVRTYDVIESNVLNQRNLNNYKYEYHHTHEIRDRVNQAVKQTLMGRRNIGLFLSGGIDSTSILYEMKELGIKPNTFTSEFELIDPNSRLNDDSNLAKIIAEKYEVFNNTVNQSQQDYVDALEDTFYALEEPRQGKSFPTYYNTNKFIAQNNITVTGNLIGKSDHTTELGDYSNGQIKRIRMSQGGEAVFGDSSTANPIGLTEGVWNSFGDSDYMSIYSRNSFRIFGYGTSASPSMHAFVGRHTSSGGSFMHIGGGTSPNGTYGASNTILTVKGTTSGGEGIVQIVGLGNNATDNVGCLAFHSYAEADPTLDINGTDAAHKISILASMVYRINLPLNKIFIQGIEDITSMDIKYASELGYSIKHVGITRKAKNSIECMAHPVLVPKENIFSNVKGVMNALLIKGDKFGTSMLYGNGAGGDATASAVVSNLVEAYNFINGKDYSSQNMRDNFGINESSIKNYESIKSPFYMRIYAEDVSGVMAEITNVLAKESISIEAVTQHEPTDINSLIPIVMITNSVSFSSIKIASTNPSSLSSTNAVSIMPFLLLSTYQVCVFRILV